MNPKRPAASSSAPADRLGTGRRLAAGLFCVSLLSGCQPPPSRPDAPPTLVTVNLEHYLPLHPGSAQLREMEAELIRLRRKPALPAPRLSPLTVPEASDLPQPQRSAAPTPSPRPDLERAEREIRGDFALRRAAAAPPVPPSAPDPNPLTPAVPEVKSPPAPEPEQTSGLESQISRLSRQLEQLKERPEDRLVFTPAQLRRRRELAEITRIELRRLHQEQVDRLRAALQPAAPTPPRTAVRRPRPRKPTAPPAPDPARVDAEEQRELAALKGLPDLPLPTVPPAAAPPAAAPDDREHVASALQSIRSGRAPARINLAAYAAALQGRRDNLRRMMLAELRSAAAGACRKRGWQLTLSGPAREVTSELRPEVKAILDQENGR